MKRVILNKINRVFVGAFLLSTVVVGCQKDDNDIFDKDPIVRLDNVAMAELKQKLVDSQDGWIVTFSPDGGKYLGQYSLWFKFHDDWSLNLKSDRIASKANEEKTQYNFVMLNTLALNFPLGNEVHEFTAMNPSSLRTDIEFVFSKYVDENTIEFVGHMTKQKIYFKKATKEIRDGFDLHYSMYENMNRIDLPFFRTLEVESAGVKTHIDFTNYDSARAVELDDNDLIKETEYELVYNSTGFIVLPAMEVSGKKISSFVYDANTNTFVGKDGDVKVSFKYSSKPAVWTDMSYKKLLGSKDNLTSQFIFDSATEEQLINSKVTSPYFKQLIEGLGISANGAYNLAEMEFVFNVNIGLPVNANYVQYTYKGKKYLYFFAFQDLKDRVKVVAIQWNDSSTVPAEVKEFNNKILGGELYIRNENFKIKYGANPIGTFISTNAPISFPAWNTNEPYVFN